MQEIREYFLQQARKVDSDIKAKSQPLDNASYSQIDVDCAYHLYIGVNQTKLRHNDALTDTFACKMKIYVSSKNEHDVNYDKGFNKALCIRNELVKSSNVADNNYINEVIPQSVKPIDDGTNSAVFIFEINVNISVTYDLIETE